MKKSFKKTLASLLIAGATLIPAESFGGGILSRIRQARHHSYTQNYNQTYRGQSFIETINSEPYNINQVLIMGVGRVEPPVEYKTNFDKIISLSDGGNKYIDSFKATLDHSKISTPTTPDLKELYGQRVNTIWAYSQGVDKFINEVKIGNIPAPNKFIAIDPPGAYRNWNKELPGVKVEIYVAEKSFFKYLPEISTRNITNRGGNNETIPSAGYTFRFGGGESNIHSIPTTHNLDSCIKEIIQLHPNYQSSSAFKTDLSPGTIQNPTIHQQQIYNPPIRISPHNLGNNPAFKTDLSPATTQHSLPHFNQFYPSQSTVIRDHVFHNDVGRSFRQPQIYQHNPAFKTDLSPATTQHNFGFYNRIQPFNPTMSIPTPIPYTPTFSTPSFR